MRIAIEFESVEEALPFILALRPTGDVPTPQWHVPPTDPVPAAQPATTEDKPKRPRRTKAQIEADEAFAKEQAEKAAAAAKVVESDPEDTPTAQSSEFDEPTTESQGDFLDDDDVAPAPALSRDDVRAALVDYQERRTDAGDSVESARTTVLALLKKVSGADKLGGCPDNKFAEVIKAAKNAK